MSTDTNQKLKNAIAEQDAQLDQIAISISRTGQMAHGINNELTLHNQMLDKLHDDVENVDSAIKAVTRYTKNVATITKENKGICCMFLLIILLVVVLILFVVYL